MKKVFNWLCRWVLWVPILFAEGPDSGETFVIAVAFFVGFGLAPVAVIGYVLFFEPGQTWLAGWVAALACVIWYLLVGLCAYVLLPGGSSYGHWSERGAW
jgi:hypothetical protein